MLIYGRGNGKISIQRTSLISLWNNAAGPNKPFVF